MTRTTRKILFALTVTTALCVDQVAVAAPTLRPQVAELAGRIVTRLTRGFRESVTVELPVHARREAQPPGCSLATVQSGGNVPHRALSPFEFRLPPPAI